MPRRSRAVVTAALCLALVAPVCAHAHVTIAPPFVEAGVETRVEFDVPNERRGHATTSLSVAAPPGVAISARGSPGGSVTQAGSVVRWSGVRIRGERTKSFPAAVTARTPPGQVVFRVTQGYDDGKVVRWETTLTVLPGSEAESPPQHFRRALTAGVVGLVVIAASLVALRRLRRRGSLQER